jgi:hypothetical protein
MIQLAFTGQGIVAACAGLALLITATGRLIWNIRRDPRGEGSRLPRQLPPAE